MKNNKVKLVIPSEDEKEKVSNIIKKYPEFQENGNIHRESFYGDLKPNTKETLMDFEIKLGIKDDGAVEYSYNNFGFRCDDFYVQDSGKYHVLFSGCSETEGASNKLEDVWANKLYEKIKKDHDVSGYYNVGKAGLTPFMIIKNCITYMEKFGKPDSIFMVIPDHYRLTSWDTENLKYSYFFINSDYNLFQKSYEDHSIGREQNYSNIKNHQMFSFSVIIMFEMFCKLNGIKLFWSSWSKDSYFNKLESLGLKNFVDIANNKKELEEFKLKDFTARDGAHLGPAFHSIWANKMYDAWSECDKN